MRLSVPTRLVTTGMREATWLFEQQRRTAGLYGAVGNFGDFEDGIDLRADAFEFAALFELADKISADPCTPLPLPDDALADGVRLLCLRNFITEGSRARSAGRISFGMNAVKWMLGVTRGAEFKQPR